MLLHLSADAQHASKGFRTHRKETKSSVNPVSPRKLIWILEENPTCRMMLASILGSRFELQVIPSLSALCYAVTTTEPPSLLIADLAQSDGSFLDLLASPKLKPSLTFPLLITSGGSDLESMRECIRLGAFDVLAKPLTPNLILLKVEMALGMARPATTISTTTPTLDQIESRVRFRGQVSDRLTRRELEMFCTFNHTFQRPLDRAEVLARIWGPAVTPKVFDVHLSHLRTKLRQIGLEIHFQIDGRYVLQPLPEANFGAGHVA